MLEYLRGKVGTYLSDFGESSKVSKEYEFCQQKENDLTHASLKLHFLVTQATATWKTTLLIFDRVFSLFICYIVYS